MTKRVLKEDVLRQTCNTMENGYKYLIKVDFNKTLLLVCCCPKFTEKTAVAFPTLLP